MDKKRPDPFAEFRAEILRSIAQYPTDAEWQHLSREWIERAFRRRYMYNFSWLGRPVIQMPTDIVAMQEIIWSVKPDLIVETGIAHGGSVVLSASMLAMLDYCEAVERNETLDPRRPRRRVLGLDIEIRAHNRAAIEAHPVGNRIEMIEGSSTAPDIVDRVRDIASAYRRVLVCLDSNHTHEHVLAELEAYAPIVARHSYCVVFDTIVEDMPDGLFPDRPWRKGNNPRTAVHEYLRRLADEGRTAADGASLNFEIDGTIGDKLLISAAPGGYLRRV